MENRAVQFIKFPGIKEEFIPGIPAGRYASGKATAQGYSKRHVHFALIPVAILIPIIIASDPHHYEQYKRDISLQLKSQIKKQQGR